MIGGTQMHRLPVFCDAAGCRTNVQAVAWNVGLTSAFIVAGRDPKHIDYLRVRLGPYDLLSLFSSTDPETDKVVTAGEQAAALSALRMPRNMTGFRVELADLPGQGIRIPEGWPLSLELGFSADMPQGRTIVIQELVGC